MSAATGSVPNVGIGRRARWAAAAAAAAAAGAALPAGMLAWTAAGVASAERAYPRLGDMIDADGTRLHCVISGTGPPVVLLHGNPGTVHSYIPAIPALLDREYRLIALDRPGHGYSERLAVDSGSPLAQTAAVRAVLRRLGIERPIVVAHSWAGAMALAWAVEFPGEVAGLVLAEGTFYDEPRLLDPAYHLLAPPATGAVVAWTAGRLLARRKMPAKLAEGWAPMPVPDHVAARSLALWSRPEALRAVAGDALTRAALLPALSLRWKEIRCPTVIAACPDDHFVDPSRHAYRLHGELPNSVLIEVPGVGHALPDARPDVVVQGIRMIADMTC
jgi:pimeloyl-ACP methyl ester carboxylesterase